MSGIPYAWKKRFQAIRNDYLERTGRQVFVPKEFEDWLKDQPDHQAFSWFFPDA